MLRSIFLLFSSLMLVGCCTAPKNFSYRYNNAPTDLEKLINIEGCYVAEHGCDSTFFSLFMFYPNGLFTIATTSELSGELIECFTNGGNSTICKYPLWGLYEVKGDTIQTQTIRPEGGGCVIFRDYKILHNKDIVNISDYVEPQHTQMAYMENYPSFRINESGKPCIFYPSATKRPISDCPLLNQKWFGRKEN